MLPEYIFTFQMFLPSFRIAFAYITYEIRIIITNGVILVVSDRLNSNTRHALNSRFMIISARVCRSTVTYESRASVLNRKLKLSLLSLDVLRSFCIDIILQTDASEFYPFVIIRRLISLIGKNISDTRTRFL